MKVLPKRRTPTVEEFYNELYKDVDRKPKKRRAALIAAGIAAAVCLAAAIPLLIRSVGSPAGLREPTDVEQAGLFARAAAARDSADFMTLMNDELVPSIVVPEGVFISIDRSVGPVRLDKPLLIEDGAGFDCGPCMWMSSELWVEPGGSLTESFLTVEGGSWCWRGAIGAPPPQ